MSTVNLKPQQEGAFRGWTSLIGAVLGFRAIDDSNGTTHDSDATYLTIPKLASPSGRVSFPFFLQWAGGIPSAVTVNVVARRGGAAHPRIQIGFTRSGAVAFSGSLLDPGSSWTLGSITFSTDPLTGLAWVPGNMPITEVCIQNENGVNGNNDVTLISASVDFAGPHNFDPLIPRGLSLE